MKIVSYIYYKKIKMKTTSSPNQYKYKYSKIGKKKWYFVWYGYEI